MGDRVVTLAPGANGRTVTSVTGTVVAMNASEMSLSVRIDDDNEIRKLEGGEIESSRLAHGFAVTVHRSQGATVKLAHRLDDGGGRELAYVGMSRATDGTTLYMVADSLAQACEILRHEWSTDRRVGWVIDMAPSTWQPEVPVPNANALRRGRLIAEREAILAVAPPDPTAAIRAAELERRRLAGERKELAKGTGRYRDEDVGRAVRELNQESGRVASLERQIASKSTPRPLRRCGRPSFPMPGDAKSPSPSWAGRNTHAWTAWKTTSADASRASSRQRGAFSQWTDRHPEASRRLDILENQIDALTQVVQRDGLARQNLREHDPQSVTRADDHGLAIDFGP